MTARVLFPAVLLVALLPSGYLAWQSRDMPHLGHYHDDGVYWVTAKALASGHEYRIESLPERPYQTKYPPLYPLLLSGVWRVWPSFPANLLLALLVSWLLLPVYVVLVRLVFQDLGAGRVEAWALCAVLALNPTVVFLSINLMADLLFCSLLCACLHLTHRAAKVSEPAWLAALAGALAGAAYLARSAGLVLLVAGPLWFLLQKQRRRALLYAGAMAPAVLAWSLWVKSHLRPPSDFSLIYYTNYVGWQLYNTSWSTLPSIVLDNLYFLLSSISQLIVRSDSDSFLGGFYWRLFAFAAIAGVIRLTRKAAITPYHLFAAAFVPLLLVCSWPPDERQILPIFPLLLAGLWSELGHIVEMLRSSFRRAQAGPKIAAGFIVTGLAAFACQAVYFGWNALFRFLPGMIQQHRELLASERKAYEWISQNLPVQTAFLAYDDTVLYLYTDRPALSIPVPIKLYQAGGPEALVRLYASSPDFARRHQLTGRITTAADFYRGELTNEQRQRVRQSIDASRTFRTVFESSMVSIQVLEPAAAPAERGG